MTEKEKQIQNILNSLSQKLGESPDKLKANMQNGDMSKVFNNMDRKQAERVQSILNDREKTEKLLSTPQAQALLKKLMGDK
ncbi:MAG: hypothetical protein U0L18_06070 [Acutalibacteraceae bacterium]|nr:hypothetical protein [Acutalibacteraceae bacterium]